VYLVGDGFTVADLTAAALLGPLLQPPEIQYPLRVELPTYLQDYRATLLKHPAMQWAAGIFRRHRGRSAGVHPVVDRLNALQALEVTNE
jgi:glutathione S-transferase